MLLPLNMRHDGIPQRRTREIDVTAAIMLDGDAVLLSRRPQGDPLAGHWELPGGKLELGEMPQACLARELFEELGIEARVGELFAVSRHSYPHVTVRLLAYRIASWRGEFELRAHDEHRWVATTEVLNLPLAPADIPIVERLLSPRR